MYCAEVAPPPNKPKTNRIRKHNKQTTIIILNKTEQMYTNTKKSLQRPTVVYLQQRKTLLGRLAKRQAWPQPWCPCRFERLATTYSSVHVSNPVRAWTSFCNKKFNLCLKLCPLITHLSLAQIDGFLGSYFGKKQKYPEKTQLSNLRTAKHLICWHRGSNPDHTGKRSAP